MNIRNKVFNFVIILLFGPFFDVAEISCWNLFAPRK